MGTNEFHAGGNAAMDWHPNDPVGVELLLVASCYYRKRNKHVMGH